MPLLRKQYLWSVAEWLLATAFVVAAALLSKLFTRNSAGVSSIWLANGIMLGFLLHTPRSRWLGLLTAFALGQVIGSVAVRDPPLGTLMAVLFNTLEVLAAGLPLASRIG